MTSAHLRRQWRSIFLINVPFGIIAAALAWRVLPRRGGEDPSARDGLFRNPLDLQPARLADQTPAMQRQPG